MSTLSPISSPFKMAVFIENADDMLEEQEQEEQSSSSGDGGLSTWKQDETHDDIDNLEDNGGGLSEWKTKRKRNGLKGRTPKHPLNKRPYTC